MMIDMLNCKITAWEVHETECGELASPLLHGVVMLYISVELPSHGQWADKEAINTSGNDQIQ